MCKIVCYHEIRVKCGKNALLFIYILTAYSLRGFFFQEVYLYLSADAAEKVRPVFAELIKFSLNRQKWDKRYGFFPRFFRRRAQTFNYNVPQPCQRNL